MTKYWFLVFSVLLTGSPLAEGLERPAQPLRVVPAIDLDRYMGSWYEIARLPNRFQKECAGEVVATYSLREDGRIDVLNQCNRNDGDVQRAAGIARIADENGPLTKLEVRFAPSFLSFLPFVWGNYWILDLATDYSYAVVGEPERKYLWILSRAPQMDEATLQGILARLAKQGYDTERLAKTRQEADTK
jgi:apolipoprotein D and lipocalin family protein